MRMLVLRALTHVRIAYRAREIPAARQGCNELQKLTDQCHAPDFCGAGSTEMVISSVGK